MTLVVIATGGTIASTRDPITGAVQPTVAPEDLVRSVPGLGQLAELEVVEIDRVSGWNMTPPTMLAVAKSLREKLADRDVTGAVVTHGTDTVEETAFVADLLVEGSKPIAFAAAMRSGDELGADGQRNFLNAARVALSPDARGWGALVVLNDEIHAARWSTKLESFRVSAFRSPGHGAVGAVTPSRISITAPLPRFVIEPPQALELEIPIIKTYTGMPESLIEDVVSATNAAGLVVEGTGAGNVPAAAMRGIAAVLEEIPVVIATRVPWGGVVTIYGGPGGGVTLEDMGVLSAGALTAAKARLLLMASLATSESQDAATSVFEHAVRELAPGAFGVETRSRTATGPPSGR